LVTKAEWCTYIDSLHMNSKLITDEHPAVEKLREPLINSINKRIPNKKFGIFFSGGVDSTLISYLCKKVTDDFICYTVGIEGSDDLKESVKVAKKLKLKHVTKILTQTELEELFSRTAKIIPVVDIVSLGVGSVELAAIDLAKKDKIDTMFGGLGSEEIFAGYQRHEQSADINEECWNGLKTTYDRDFIRDYAIAVAAKMNFLTPYLDKELIIAAMSISGNLKIKQGIKKYIFRKAAIDLGLLEEFAMRPKKAAQYGSGFDKAIIRIAKSKGYKFKKGYLEFLSDNK